MLRYAGLTGMLFFATSVAAQEPSELQQRLRKTVGFLASDEMKGRLTGSPECNKAAEWIACEFETIGLKPWLKEGFFQEFTAPRKGAQKARNVIAVLEGETDEYVVIGAHHDHEGAEGGQVFNGADDNASGVAALIEIARLAVAGGKPHRGILFCSFDAEESGMVGSHQFVRSDETDESKFSAMVCMDMLGGNFFPRDTTGLYALGSENSPELTRLLSEQKPVEGLEVHPLGIYIIEPMGELGARSDYTSFRAKKIPFVFFSSGTPWYYHTPEDDPERLNYDKLERAVGFIHRFTLDVAGAETRPTFQKSGKVRAEDIQIVAAKLRTVLEHPEDVGLDEKTQKGLKGKLEMIDEALSRKGDDQELRKAFQEIVQVLLSVIRRPPEEEKK